MCLSADEWSRKTISRPMPATRPVSIVFRVASRFYLPNHSSIMVRFYFFLIAVSTCVVPMFFISDQVQSECTGFPIHRFIAETVFLCNSILGIRKRAAAISEYETAPQIDRPRAGCFADQALPHEHLWQLIFSLFVLCAMVFFVLSHYCCAFRLFAFACGNENRIETKWNSKSRINGSLGRNDVSLSRSLAIFHLRLHNARVDFSEHQLWSMIIIFPHRDFHALPFHLLDEKFTINLRSFVISKGKIKEKESEINWVEGR